VNSLDRYVAEGGVESIRIDVRVRDRCSEAPERGFALTLYKTATP